jgi:hypothetical protein
MKHLFIFLFLIFSIGCTAEDGDRGRTREILEEAQKQIGMPEIKNFQEKKLAKMVMELRDREDLICYVYIKSDYQGTLHFVGKSIGYGIPYGLSLTNPEQRNGISQAEPNALYTNGATTSATWLFMIDPKSGEPKPIYFEPEIVVSPFPLH